MPEFSPRPIIVVLLATGTTMSFLYSLAKFLRSAASFGSCEPSKFAWHEAP